MEMRTEYRITGIFRVDLKKNKRHVVDADRKWTKADAEYRMLQIQHEAQAEIESKKAKCTMVGSIGVETEYSSDYDLLDLRIESRQVTPWSTIE